MQYSLRGSQFVFEYGCVKKSIDLSKSIKAKLYNRPEKRYFDLSNFQLGNISIYQNILRYNLLNEDYGLIIPIVIKIADDELEFIVETGSIVETLGTSYRIMEVSVLTDFMQSSIDDDGFYMLPAYSGTLVKLNSQQPIQNRDRIYISQQEWEKFSLINCFASNVNGTGILAIIDDGDFFAWCDTELNNNKSNNIYASFGIRHNFSEVLPQGKKKLIYKFFPECSGYPEMALSYRDYLIKKHSIVPLKYRIENNPVLKYSAVAMRVKVFMGYKKPYIHDGSSPLTVCSTFAEVENMLDAMLLVGIDKAIITIVGWNLGGHDGAYPTRFPVEEALGGEIGLKKLIAKALEMNYQIVPHDNITDVYLNAPAFDFEYVSRDEGGEPQPSGLWAGGQSFKVCPTVYLDRYGSDFKRIKELGFEGSYYLDAQATGLFSCTDRKHPADEKQFAISLARIMEYPREIYGAVSCECAPAYSLKFFDEVARIHGENEFEQVKACLPEHFQTIVDRVVPFYNIAVHGLILYQDQWVHCNRDKKGGVWQGVLKELAVGARPSMEISSNNKGNGDKYADSIRDIYKAYKISFEILKDIHYEFIKKYEEFSPEACRIIYNNEYTVEVNCSEYETEGIPANSVIIYKQNKVVFDSNTN